MLDDPVGPARPPASVRMSLAVRGPVLAGRAEVISTLAVGLVRSTVCPLDVDTLETFPRLLPAFTEK